jgi:transposase-like protein
MTDRIAVRHRLRVKQRRRIVEYAKEHGIKLASRHFGLARRTVRTWVRRWKVVGQFELPKPMHDRSSISVGGSPTVDKCLAARTPIAHRHPTVYRS